MTPVSVSVYSTSNSAYQSWQSELLDGSFRAVGQAGRLIRLCSQDEDLSRPFDKSEIARVIALPNWMQNESTGDFWGIANKTNSLHEWLAQDTDLDDAEVVLFLDPDMVFVRSVEVAAEPGVVVGQRWVDLGMAEHRHWKRYGESVQHLITPDAIVMYPFCATAGDMRAIALRFRDLSQQIRDENLDCWEADMFGLVIAMLEGGLKIRTLENFGVCNNWTEERESLPTLIHYPAPVVDCEENEIWFKQSYTRRTHERPWKRPAPFQHATNALERELLRIIHAHVTRQEQNSS